uniref:photosystem II assembly protein Psb34 n=1 Tax=Cyanobium sp. TaxID=2164130 RepID=UPI00404A19E1
MKNPSIQVTQDDGGRLNASAKKPRTVVMEKGETQGPASKLLLLGGTVLVLTLVAVAARIS